MARVAKNARIGVKTITKLSRDEIAPLRTRKQTSIGSNVTVVRVDKRVWKLALQIAHGDSSRFEIIDEHTIRVVNQSKRKR